MNGRTQRGPELYLYAERGLSRRRVSIWLREGQFHIAYHDAILAQYAYRYDRKGRRLQTVDTPRVFQTPYSLRVPAVRVLGAGRRAVAEDHMPAL